MLDWVAIPPIATTAPVDALVVAFVERTETVVLKIVEFRKVEVPPMLRFPNAVRFAPITADLATPKPPLVIIDPVKELVASVVDWNKPVPATVT